MTNPKTMSIDLDRKRNRLTATTTEYVERNETFGVRLPAGAPGLNDIAELIMVTADQENVHVIEVPRNGIEGVLGDMLSQLNAKRAHPLTIMSVARPVEPKPEIDPDKIGTGSQAAVLVGTGAGRWVIATAERGLGNELLWSHRRDAHERTLVGVTRYDEKRFRMLSHLSPAGHPVEVTA